MKLKDYINTTDIDDRRSNPSYPFWHTFIENAQAKVGKRMAERRNEKEIEEAAKTGRDPVLEDVPLVSYGSNTEEEIDFWARNHPYFMAFDMSGKFMESSVGGTGIRMENMRMIFEAINTLQKMGMHGVYPTPVSIGSGYRVVVPQTEKETMDDGRIVEVPVKTSNGTVKYKYATAEYTGLGMYGSQDGGVARTVLEESGFSLDYLLGEKWHQERYSWTYQGNRSGLAGATHHYDGTRTVYASGAFNACYFDGIYDFTSWSHTACLTRYLPTCAGMWINNLDRSRAVTRRDMPSGVCVYAGDSIPEKDGRPKEIPWNGPPVGGGGQYGIFGLPVGGSFSFSSAFPDCVSTHVQKAKMTLDTSGDVEKEVWEYEHVVNGRAVSGAEYDKLSEIVSISANDEAWAESNAAIMRAVASANEGSAPSSFVSSGRLRKMFDGGRRIRVLRYPKVLDEDGNVEEEAVYDVIDGLEVEEGDIRKIASDLEKTWRFTISVPTSRYTSPGSTCTDGAYTGSYVYTSTDKEGKTYTTSNTYGDDPRTSEWGPTHFSVGHNKSSYRRDVNDNEEGYVSTTTVREERQKPSASGKMYIYVPMGDTNEPGGTSISPIVTPVSMTVSLCVYRDDHYDYTRSQYARRTSYPRTYRRVSCTATYSYTTTFRIVDLEAKFEGYVASERPTKEYGSGRYADTSKISSSCPVVDSGFYPSGVYSSSAPVYAVFSLEGSDIADAQSSLGSGVGTLPDGVSLNAGKDEHVYYRAYSDCGFVGHRYGHGGVGCVLSATVTFPR